MKESSHTLPTGEPEETLVTPRFDAEETVQAQPVVPFAEVPPGAVDVPYNGARRRASWPLALVLVSALAGVIVGGAGLYFYQHRSTENATADTQTAPPETSEEAPPVASAGEVSASLPAQEAEPDAEVVSSEVVEPPVDDEKKTDDAKKEEAEKAPAPEPRKVAERDAEASTPKRGKKDERDAEPARRTPRAERVGSREVARDDDDEPQARLSDEIIFRRERRAERRAERRERRANRTRSVDRVRGIFEGQPE